MRVARERNVTAGENHEGLRCANPTGRHRLHILSDSVNPEHFFAAQIDWREANGLFDQCRYGRAFDVNRIAIRETPTLCTLEDKRGTFAIG